jgi:hypothetical protein
MVALFNFVYALVVAAAVSATTLVVPHVGNGQDDTPGLLSALKSASLAGGLSQILFSKGITYNILTPVDFGTLTNVEIAVEGNITLPSSIIDVQNIVANTVSTKNLASTSKY